MNLASKQDIPATKLRILAAAEVLFVEKGFAASSLRAIAKEANVNLAATHYHFGSKEGLYAATLHHCIGPFNQARLLALDQLEASQKKQSVENILEAFFKPFVEESLSPGIPKLMARIYSEAESLTRPILQGEFKEVMQRFTKALAKQLPDIPKSELHWRFHFMIGAMIHLLNFDHPMSANKRTESRAKQFKKLISFVAAGLKQNQ